jgi:hypothetical protein
MRGKVVVLALVGLTIGGGVSAAAPASPVVPGNALVAGRGYGQWVVAAYRWRLSRPNRTPNQTSCFTGGQHGPVWFLGHGTLNATVTCAIPAGRYLMMYTPSVDCSTVEPAPYHATTDTGLMRCAKRQWQRDPGLLSVTLDGVSLRPAGYVGGTPAFGYRMPTHNNWEDAPGHTHGRMAVYGSASILRPLSPGTHRLVITSGGSHPADSSQVTFQLTVG